MLDWLLWASEAQECFLFPSGLRDARPSQRRECSVDAESAFRAFGESVWRRIVRDNAKMFSRNGMRFSETRRILAGSWAQHGICCVFLFGPLPGQEEGPSSSTQPFLCSVSVVFFCSSRRALADQNQIQRGIKRVGQTQR